MQGMAFLLVEILNFTICFLIQEIRNLVSKYQYDV